MGRSPAGVLARALIFTATLVTLPSPALASPEDDLQAAQRRANQAAKELADAQEETARAEDAVTHAQARLATVEARVAVARDRVRELAVRRYVEGAVPLSRMLGMTDANQVVRANQYSRVVAEVSTDALGQFRADREDLDDELAALRNKQESQADSLAALGRRQANAVEELDRLSAVVEQARAAQERERRAQMAAAAPARPASPTPTAAPSRGAPVPPGPAAAVAPAAPAPSVAAQGWVCPVQGPRAFSNDYGAPRPGGRSHMGNDILSPRGTPVVANVGGVVTHRSGAVSGRAYYLAGDDGTRYFGAHLDSFGASGRVSAGTQIGTVGTTGDASGGPPHLHFEIHPNGTGNINPFQTLTRYC